MVLESVILWGAAAVAIVAVIYWISWGVITMIAVNKIPGPPTYPIIGNLLDIKVPSG